MFSGESIVGASAVAAYPEDFSAEILELLVRVTKPASFRCAAPGEVFRIEVYDHILPPVKVVQANVLAFAGQQTKIRRGITYSNQASSPRSAPPPPLPSTLIRASA